MNFTQRKFTIYLAQIGVIMKMENGDSGTKQGSLTGDAAHRAALRMFKKAK